MISQRVPGYSLPDPNLHFLASENRIYDYGNLYGFAEWFKDKLDSWQIDEHRPLLIVSNSSDEKVFAIAACWLLQLPFISLSPGMTDSELENALSQIDPPIAITDSENRHRLQNLPLLSPLQEHMELQKGVDRSLFSNGEPDKLLGYFLTSGSTGAPKIVPVKRRQVLYAASASEENFKPEKNHYWLLCLPLNHTGGISIIMRSLLYHSAIYRINRFNEEQVIRFLADNKLFQAASMVPTMLNRLLHDRKFRVHLGFQALLLGGGPVTLSLIERAMERGVPAVASYGMTETFGQIAANHFLKPSGIYHPKKSVGRVFRPNEAQIRDDNGEILSQNESGTLWLRGPQVFDGYRDEEQNRETFDSDGWFNTGDYGYLNRNRQLFIEARRTDLILTGGENVNPFEVETALEELETVQEAAVVGLADEEWGQVVTAFITTTDNHAPDEAMLKSSLKRRLSPYKVPRQIIHVDQFPKTDSGKLHKRRLVEIYEGKLT